MEYGPLVVRARQDFQRQHAVARSAELRGVALVTPPASEWYLLCSLFVELGLGLLLGGLVASAGGLITAPPWRSSLGKHTTRRIDLNGSRRVGAMDYEWQLTTAIGSQTVTRKYPTQ